MTQNLHEKSVILHLVIGKKGRDYFSYIERIYQMSYSSLSDNGMLQIFSFLIKGLYGAL